MRIALFGGSFDPPHRGHLAIAAAAADCFHLDRVLFAPTGLQPLKDTGASASYPQRLAMVQAACAADPRFAPSGLDAPRGHHPNYTVDALARFATEFRTAHRFYLAGADSFQTIASWHQHERLFDHAAWIVVSRPGYPLLDPPGLTVTPQQRSRILLLDSIHDDVSATGLRHRLAHADPCHDLLPAPVAAYIRQHGLYSA